MRINLLKVEEGKMLTRWTIENFKSMAESTSLEIAPLTLICGANSSGKSTILQSMLAVAQTFGSGSRTRALILNGNLVRLGDFTDLLHAGNTSREMGIGFALQSFKGPNVSAERTELEIRISPQEHKSEGRQTFPIVRGYSLRVLALPDRKVVRVLELRYGKHNIYPDFEYTISEIAGIEPGVVLSGDIKPTHARIGGLVPTALLMEYNVVSRRATDDFERLILIVSDDSDTLLPDSMRTEPVPRYIWALLERVLRQLQRQQRVHSLAQELESLLKTASRKPFTWEDLAREVRGPSITMDRRGEVRDRAKWTLGARQVLRDRLLGLKREWIEQIERENPQTTHEPRHIPEHLQLVVNEMKAFWSDRFLYLGPLRDDPKVIFAAPTDIEKRSVGAKGEFTAAILTEWRDTQVEYPLPPTKGSELGTTRGKGTLVEAATTWLRHMALVDEVKTRELAKIGYELTVHPTGLQRPLDLMNVGVGVSQVLPTLVLSLVAPPGSTLVLEQPELHLHPGVQSILGDFFLGIAAMGKQCIIETHSEHLINRVRRRIAEADGDSVMRLTRMYFAEKPGMATRIIPVEPNEYGAIPEWPKGFFDEAADEAERIIDAATRKRQRQLQQKAEASKPQVETRR